MLLLLVNFGIISGVFGNVMAILGASDQIINLMQYEPKINTEGGQKLDESSQGTIEFKDVCFSYPSKSTV
jgi:ABC-type multidrug transport system fused ATPase/permease subunit